MVNLCEDGQVVQTKKPQVLKYGLNHVTTLVEQKIAKLAPRPVLKVVKLEIGGDRSRRRPYRAGVLAAGALPQEGRALLHHQGQVKVGPADSPEGLCLRGDHKCEAGGREGVESFRNDL